MLKKILIAVVVSTAGWIMFYAVISEIFKLKLNIRKQWVCEAADGTQFTAAFFPDHGGASGPDKISDLIKDCPDIQFDPGKETLFLAHEFQLKKMGYHPFLKWRLTKSWTYADITWTNEPTNGKVYVYVVPRDDIGFEQ